MSKPFFSTVLTALCLIIAAWLPAGAQQKVRFDKDKHYKIVLKSNTKYVIEETAPRQLLSKKTAPTPRNSSGASLGYRAAGA